MAQSRRDSIRSSIRRDATLRGAIGNQAQNVESGVHGKIVVLPADEIHFNENNPRRLPFSREDMAQWHAAAAAHKQDPEAFFDALTRHVIERYAENEETRDKAVALVELAWSISVKLIQPPTVFQTSRSGEPSAYTVEAGERRVRAMLILGRSEMPVILDTTGPEQREFAALSENIQREDLSFPEKLAAMDRLCKTWQTDHPGKELTSSVLTSIIKKEERTARRYLAIIKNRDVYTDVLEGRVSSLRGALERVKEFSEEADSDHKAKQKFQPKSKRTARRSVNLRRIEEPRILYTVVERVLGDEFENVVGTDVDWTSLDSVQKAWDKTLEHLIKAKKR